MSVIHRSRVSEQLNGETGTDSANEQRDTMYQDIAAMQRQKPDLNAFLFQNNNVPYLKSDGPEAE